MASRKSSALGELGAAAVGAAIGGILGVLFSPKSGKQNRQFVAKEAKKAVRVAEKVVKKATSQKSVPKAKRKSTSKKRK